MNEKEFTEAVAKGNDYMQLKNYDEAVEHYTVALSIKKDEHISVLLAQAKSLQSSSASYVEGMKLFEEQNYVGAKEQLSLVCSDDVEHYKKATMTLQGIKLIFSGKSLEDGVGLFQDNEYGSAIEMLKNVVIEDEDNYQLAQEYIKEAEILWSQELIEEAANLFSDKEFTSAVEIAQKAIGLNPNLKDADQLFKKALSEQERALKEKLKAEAIDRMRTYEGSGSARVAVVGVIARSSFYDGFTTWRPDDPENVWFLHVGVVVKNSSNSSIHANPSYITLICKGQVFNPDLKTYSMDNYFDAIDLQPDTHTFGWLLFLVPKADSYTLVYRGAFDSTIRKELIVTEKR